MFLELQDMQGSKVLGDETAAMYERAITGIMKHSMLLYFAYADFEEVKKKLLDNMTFGKTTISPWMSSCKALISNFSREKDHLLIGGCFVKRVANYSLVLILLLLKPNSYNKVAIETGFPCIPTI